jgi:hypothetical protein
VGKVQYWWDVWGENNGKGAPVLEFAKFIKLLPTKRGDAVALFSTRGWKRTSMDDVIDALAFVGVGWRKENFAIAVLSCCSTQVLACRIVEFFGASHHSDMTNHGLHQPIQTNPKT